MKDMSNALLRCVYCNVLVTPGEIKKDGACICGSRKMRVAFAVTEEEMKQAIARGYEPGDGFTENREEAWESE